MALLALLVLVLLGASPAARADAYTFSFSGPGISGSGIITIAATGTPGTDQITGITGNYSDTTAGFSGAITGLESSPLPSTPPPFPAPAHSAAGFSYDNLFYPGGSPLVCSDYPFFGGVFDVYGVVFDVAGGYTVDLWSNGVVPGAGLTYAVADAYGTSFLNYPDPADGGGVDVDLVTAPAPEPGSLLLLGTGLPGLVAVLRRRRERATSNA